MEKPPSRSFAEVHQGNVPLHTHGLTYNEDWTILYTVGRDKILILELAE